MLYDVTVTIDYAYDQPSASGRNLIRLMPASVAGQQRLVAGVLASDPVATERIERADFFGNPVTEFAFRSPARATHFRMQARVERFAEAPGLDLSPPLDGLAAELRAMPSLDPEAPQHFLGRSERVRPAAPMTDYALAALAAAAPAGRPITARAAVEAVGHALFGDMRFDARATTVDTDPAEAFAARHGVCQDFTHVMIACLRGLGVPAGYVSGYLRTVPPEGEDRLAGADAMHAWVRAWCGIETGWIEFDPTNDLLVGADHIRVAVGRDYDDVAPVRGVLRTAGPHRSRHSVDVIALG